MRKHYSRSLIFIIVISLTCITSNAKTEEEPALKAAYKLFDALDMTNTYKQTIAKTVDMQIKQNPQIALFRNTLLTFFDKYMGWENMKAEMAKIYTNQFTTEEINKLTEFYQTPLGIKAGKLVPEMMTEAAAIGQKKIQDNIGELQRMIAEEAQTRKTVEEE